MTGLDTPHPEDAARAEGYRLGQESIHAACRDFMRAKGYKVGDDEPALEIVAYLIRMLDAR